MVALHRLAGAFVAACLLAASAAAQTATAPAPAPDAPLFTLQMLGPGVYAAIGGPKAGSNAGFVVGDDGVLVVDSFFNPDAAKALLAEIRKVTDKPIRYLVNTHYHIDHVRGDAVFKAAGATIIAHKNVPGWIHPENIHLLGGDKISSRAKADVDALILPDRTVDKPTVITLGQRKVELHPMTGHTGGDLVVGVLDAHVLFAGDILWNHTGPTTIDGKIAPWTADLAQIEKLPDTTFVPGHGQVATAKDVDDMRRLFEDLQRLTKEARAKGLTGDAVVKEAAPKLMALHMNWPRLERSAPFLVAEMDQELAGTKRTPVPAN